jgi:hypothetical protein
LVRESREAWTGLRVVRVEDHLPVVEALLEADPVVVDLVPEA